MRFSRTESPVGVNRGRGWSTFDAARWLHANGFGGLTPLATPGQWRYRQLDPERGHPDSFRTVSDSLPRGVQAVTVDVIP